MPIDSENKNSEFFRPGQHDDRRRVRYEDVSRVDYIPFLGGRPDRDNEIGRDDVTNLRIGLEVATDFETFLFMF